MQKHRRILFAHPGQNFSRHSGLRPRLGLAGMEHATVGETGFHRHVALPIEEVNFVAGLGKVVGGGGADDSSAQDDRFHDVTRDTGWWIRLPRTLWNYSENASQAVASGANFTDAPEKATLCSMKVGSSTAASNVCSSSDPMVPLWGEPSSNTSTGSSRRFASHRCRDLPLRQATQRKRSVSPDLASMCGDPAAEAK